MELLESACQGLHSITTFSTVLGWKQLKWCNFLCVEWLQKQRMLKGCSVGQEIACPNLLHSPICSLNPFQMIWNIQNHKRIESGNLEGESIETRKSDFLKEEYRNMRVPAKRFVQASVFSFWEVIWSKSWFFHQKISYCPL